MRPNPREAKRMRQSDSGFSKSRVCTTPLARLGTISWQSTAMAASSPIMPICRR